MFRALLAQWYMSLHETTETNIPRVSERNQQLNFGKGANERRNQDIHRRVFIDQQARSDGTPDVSLNLIEVVIAKLA